MELVESAVVVEYLSSEDALLDERWEAEKLVLRAPHLIDAEVCHGLRRKVRFSHIDEEAVSEAIWAIKELPLRRIDHEHLIHFAWDLRENFSFYNALYVVLALMLDEPLLTFDARLTRSGVDLPIEVLGQA